MNGIRAPEVRNCGSPDELISQKETTMNLKNSLLLLVILSAFTPCLSAKEAHADKLVVKNYYVGDLIAGDPKAVGADFGQLLNLLKTVVSPDSWKEDAEITCYAPNLSLVIRQREAVHAEIADLLSQLRRLNALQIGIECQMMPLDASRLDQGGEISFVSAPRLTVFNGQSGFIQIPATSAHLVRVAPISGQPVAAELAATNKPVELIVPAGKRLMIHGMATGDRKGIRLSVGIEGEQPVTRRFQATPIIQEDEQPFITGQAI